MRSLPVLQIPLQEDVHTESIKTFCQLISDYLENFYHIVGPADNSTGAKNKKFCGHLV